MAIRHTSEMLVEANKRISQLIDKIDNNDPGNQVIINEVNEVIRELDKIVESLEK